MRGGFPSYSLGYVNPKWTVLQYIIVIWMQWTNQLEENSLSTKQQKEFLGITILLSKMITQHYLIYSELHNEALQAMIEIEERNRLEEDDLIISKKSAMDVKNHPVLGNLMRTFYTIIQ